MRTGNTMVRLTDAERLEVWLRRGRDLLYVIQAEVVTVRYKPSSNWPRRGCQYYVDHTGPYTDRSIIPLPSGMPVTHALAAISMEPVYFDRYMQSQG